MLSESENDLTRELGKKLFLRIKQNLLELIRAKSSILSESIGEYEVTETWPTIWKVRCKLF